MFFQLQIVSKDKKILKKFLKFFYSLQKTSSTWNVISNFNKRSFITVLKSPHVNKTAQEQFEYRAYSKKIFINSVKPFTFLLMLKKIKGLSFSGISVKLIGLSRKSKKLKTIFNFLDPKNMILKIDNKIIKTKVGFSKYVQLFDCHGEVLLKTKYFV